MTTAQKLAIASDAADRLDAIARVGLHETDPTELYEIVGDLARLADRLGSLVSQAGYRCGEVAKREDLYADDLGPGVDPHAIAARAATSTLATGYELHRVTCGLHETHNQLSRLYLDPDGERNHRGQA